MNIGEYLKNLREEKNYSINQLALYSGVSAPHISRIERNLREASPEILKKLSKSLGVEYEELMVKAGYIPANNNDELIKDVPDEFKDLFNEQNMDYLKFAKEMIEEEIDIDTLKELIEVSKKIRQEYGNKKDKNKGK